MVAFVPLSRSQALVAYAVKRKEKEITVGPEGEIGDKKRDKTPICKKNTGETWASMACEYMKEAEFREVRRKKQPQAIVRKEKETAKLEEKERHLEWRFTEIGVKSKLPLFCAKEGIRKEINGVMRKKKKGARTAIVKVFMERVLIGVKQWKPDEWKTETAFDSVLMDIEKSNKSIHVGGMREEETASRSKENATCAINRRITWGTRDEVSR
ncbi:hypothetical protein C7212DRAFT_341051 [Tuber magnatum]|uniref:Uncharacterized protein n=1 Tax=Tuber magnatum TaxID=42249 RepID=A0A317SZN2_9PEZI|nr:hypothetical protein C7212DRAFT_341051 [Tuber magnatum]